MMLRVLWLPYSFLSSRFSQMVAPPARLVNFPAMCSGVARERWNVAYSSQNEGSETVASKNDVSSYRNPIIDSGANRPP